MAAEPTISDDNETFHGFLGALSNLYARMRAERDEIREERDRLLVLATYHCPREHHDWQELLQIAGAKQAASSE